MPIHASADVSSNATIGENTSIWNNAQVREGVTIGSGCTLSKDVYVDKNVVIGNGVKVQNGVSIYHGVTIEDNVFLGPHMTFTNDLFPRAQIWDDSMVCKTLVKEGASIGAHATIVCGTPKTPRVIGKYAMIAAGAVVTKDVPAHGFVVGVPAKLKGFVSEKGHKLVLADDADTNAALIRMHAPTTGETVEIPKEDYDLL